MSRFAIFLICIPITIIMTLFAITMFSPVDVSSHTEQQEESASLFSIKKESKELKLNINTDVVYKKDFEHVPGPFSDMIKSNFRKSLNILKPLAGDSVIIQEPAGRGGE